MHAVTDNNTSAEITSSDSDEELKSESIEATHRNKALATPAVRRIAAEHKVKSELGELSYFSYFSCFGYLTRNYLLPTSYKYLLSVLLFTLQIDLIMVKGSGKGGRVMKEDILSYVSWQNQQIPSHSRPQAIVMSPPEPSHQPQSATSVVGMSDRVVPITGYTKTMVKTMTASNVS